LLHRLGEAEPSREEKIGRMLGAQDASNAVRLEYELHARCDGFG